MYFGWFLDRFMVSKYTHMKKTFYLVATLLLLSSVISYSQTISGNLAVCLGASRTTLTISTSGGSWSSGNVAKATIDASTGVVTGVSAGTATISYTILPSTVFIAVVTVNGITMSAIGFSTGSGALCTGGSPSTCTVTPLVGNAWSSSNTSIATVNTGGLVTPSPTNTGTVTITYHHGTGNCDVTKQMTVNPTPTVSITPAMCVASTQTATATPSGGTWASSNTSVGTIGAATGGMTGSAGGTTNISYTLSTGCRRVTSVTVANLPSAITGALTVCAGNNSTLSSSPSGGTWSSASTGVATIGSSTGVVTGISAGTSLISYSVGGTCFRTATVTVNAGLPSNTGPGTVCTGQTITLVNATGGGTWSSGSPGIATVNSATGLVTGVAAGTVNISYAVGGGCSSISVVTVTSTSASITGSTNVCVGATTALSYPVGGGTWSSSNAAIGSVAATTGIVTGINVGSVTITYTIISGCYKTIALLVKATPASISGAATLCAGTTTTLSDATTGGTWSSSNTGIATVGSGSGVVTGVSNGTTAISYIISSSGCFVTQTETVSSSTGISGTLSVCAGSTTTLSSSVGGGTWSSSSTGVATIGSSTGVVTGVAAGASVISYNTGGGCVGTVTVTVNAAAGPITGASLLCVGATVTLSNGTGGGTWSSSNTSVATIGSSGIVTGVSTGTSTISYSISGSCYSTLVVNVSAAVAPITGAPYMLCTGTPTTLSCATGGGTWICTSTGVATIGATTGILTGLSTGLANISYVTTGTGCYRTTYVSVAATPAAITGATAICIGNSIILSSSPGGGVWSSSSTGVATINASTGQVTGVSAGTSSISYYTEYSGCATTVVVTVLATPAPLAGTGVLCVGTNTMLTTTGGTYWTSSNTGVATVPTTSGVVTGVSPGTATISVYNPTSGCTATLVVTVVTVPAVISGTTTVVIGSTTTLTSSPSGGTWSSSVPSVGTVVGGVVTGITSGTTIITYALGSSCYSTTVVTVTAACNISGTMSMCMGSGTTLSSIAGGGTWTSSATGVATIGSTSGVVTGVSAGTAIISFNASTGCISTSVVTVNVTPGGISGTLIVCAAAATALSDATGGGTWSSSNTSVAGIGLTSGIVSGVSLGTTTVSYVTGAGCYATAIVTVAPSSGSISGTLSVCISGTFSLSSSSGGGTWSSSNTGVAAIGFTTGVMMGVGAGTSTISYRNATGCFSTAIATVNGAPAAISGPTTVALGWTVSLSNPVSGGSWSSSNTSIATVGSSSGVVTGASLGSFTITYANGCGGAATYPMVVTATVTPCTPVYVDPAGACSSYAIYIKDFILYGSSDTVIIDTVTGCNGTGYQNRIGIVSAPILLAGTTYTANVVTGTANQAFVQVWVDFDNDGMFGTGEAVGGTAIAFFGGVSFGVDVPGGAANGTHLMRVRLAWYGSSPAYPSMPPCTSLSFGETHDYIVTISNAVPKSASPVLENSNDIRSLSVAPNPANGKVTVSSNISGEITVYTIDGKRVKEYAVKIGSTIIAMPEDIASGVYLLRFNGDDGSTQTVRLVYNP